MCVPINDIYRIQCVYFIFVRVSLYLIYRILCMFFLIKSNMHLFTLFNIDMSIVGMALCRELHGTWSGWK